MRARRPARHRVRRVRSAISTKRPQRSRLMQPARRGLQARREAFCQAQAGLSAIAIGQAYLFLASLESLFRRRVPMQSPDSHAVMSALQSASCASRRLAGTGPAWPVCPVAEALVARIAADIVAAPHQEQLSRGISLGWPLLDQLGIPFAPPAQPLKVAPGSGATA